MAHQFPGNPNPNLGGHTNIESTTMTEEERIANEIAEKLRVPIPESFFVGKIDEPKPAQYKGTKWDKEKQVRRDRKHPAHQFPISRAEAEAHAGYNIQVFKASEAHALLKQAASKEPEDSEHVKLVQAAEAREQQLLLEQLYASYFTVPTVPIDLNAPPIVQGAINELNMDETAKIETVPSKGTYTAELRRTTANAIHDANIALFKKYVPQDRYYEFMEKREKIVLATTNQQKRKNKFGKVITETVEHDGKKMSYAQKCSQVNGARIKAENKKKEEQRMTEEEADAKRKEQQDGNRYDSGYHTNGNGNENSSSSPENGDDLLEVD